MVEHIADPVVRPSRAVTRSRSCSAALREKVSASTWEGSTSRRSMRSAIASTRVVVLPVPGPARTSRGPPLWSTTRCWAASRETGSAVTSAGGTRWYVVGPLVMAPPNHPTPTGRRRRTRLTGMNDHGPLSDVVVLDLTRALAGPQAAMMLGDLGARVIKVESVAGDDTRAWGPPWAGAEVTTGSTDGPLDSTYFMSANRNKESIVLDLKDADDADVLAALVRRCDVLLENFRVGVLDRLGFSVARLHELNPQLVIGSITGFGHDGPEAQRAGYDQIAQGEGGLMSVTGTEQPTKVGVPIADLLAGMNLAYGVVAALHQRHRTGHGRVVRTSLLAGVVGVHAFQGTVWLLGRRVPGVSGAHHPAIAPYGMFATGSAPVQVAVGSEGLWRTFAGAVGLDADDERFRTNRERVAHRDELIRAIEGHFRSREAEHWLDLLLEAGVPAGKVRSMDDVYAWDQVRAQGLVLEVEHPSYGALELPGSALRFDDQPFSGGRERHLAPPLLGEHSDTIRGWLAEEGT